MVKRTDLTGFKTGQLEVLEFSHVRRRQNGSTLVYWNCLCACGNITTVMSAKLTSGRTVKSCGCLKLKEKLPPILVGKQFGRLTVVAKDLNCSARFRYVLKCSCGGVVKTDKTNLLRKEKPVSSCGKCDGNSYRGRVFGRLTILGRGLKSGQLVAICDCGNLNNVTPYRLKTSKYPSCGCFISDRLLGPLNPFWAGGVDENLSKAVRASAKMQQWTRRVKRRDGKHCKICNSRFNLHAHHIVHLASILNILMITSIEEAYACEALWDSGNGITLCKNCHNDVHFAELQF